MSMLLGHVAELDDIDDHQPKEHGTLTRCELDGQLWPCAPIEKAKRLADMDISLMEMIDVGWTVWQWAPPQLDPRPVGGLVEGYTDDDEDGRVYTVVNFHHGAPVRHKIAARDVDPQMIGLPNSKSIRDTYRQLCAHIGKRKGSADGTEVRNIAGALALAQAAT